MIKFCSLYLFQFSSDQFIAFFSARAFKGTP